MLVHARTMVKSKQTAFDTLAANADQPVGSLRITMPTFVEATWVCQRLLAFTQEFDGVSLKSPQE